MGKFLYRIGTTTMGCCQYHLMIVFGQPFLEMFEALEGEPPEDRQAMIDSIRGLAHAMEISVAAATGKPRGQA